LFKRDADTIVLSMLCVISYRFQVFMPFKSIRFLSSSFLR